MGQVMNSWYDIFNFNWDETAYSMEDIEKNTKIVKAVLEEEIQMLGGKSEKVYIGGFSQGCAMALHVGLNFDKK